MKKKISQIVIAVILVGILGFFGVRSVVGWRPFKHVAYEDMQPYAMAAYIDLENMKRESIPIAYLISMMNEIRVTTSYDGEYDPWAMDHFVYWKYGERWQNYRVGFSLDPEPIIDIGGEVYRMTGKSAGAYLDFCENFLGRDQHKVGE